METDEKEKEAEKGEVKKEKEDEKEKGEEVKKEKEDEEKKDEVSPAEIEKKKMQDEATVTSAAASALGSAAVKAKVCNFFISDQYKAEA